MTGLHQAARWYAAGRALDNLESSPEAAEATDQLVEFLTARPEEKP